MARKPPPPQKQKTKRKQKSAPARPPAVTKDPSGSGAIFTSDPQFGQPVASPDPTKFTVAHGSDDQLYNLVKVGLLQKIPPPRTQNLTVPLASIWGSSGAARVAAIQTAGQIVFHVVGDSGSVNGPATQSLVADKMVADFTDPSPADRPQFCFHLGDVVYSFGEAKFYYDQFYDPYRNYPAPIVAIPGNHDGQVYSTDSAPSLTAFLENFVTAAPMKSLQSGGLIRTTMTQPAVYFALDAPLITIIGLYSNVLEDPGVISSQGDKTSPVDDQQLTFLTSALTQAKAAGKPVIIATHHPPYSGGSAHGGSPAMLADIDGICQKLGIWPHAHLSGHAHNYQRYTRTITGFEIPYIVSGDGGHGLTAMATASAPLRTPYVISSEVTLENYNDQDYGYMRVVVGGGQIRIEFHGIATGVDAKSPVDVVTVDIASHKMVAS
jgi:hypothetical protein